MKKIALVFWGNYLFDARCMNMIDSLASVGCHITIYNNQPENYSCLHKKNNLKIINIQPSSLPVIKYIDWIQKVYRKIKKTSFDTIIAADFYSLVPLSLIKNNHQTIYDSREIYSKLSAHINSPIKNIIIKACERYCVKKINKIIVTAYSDQKYLSNIYPNKNLVYKIIYNYPLKKNIKKRSSYLRDKFSFSSNTTILLYQGVIQKNRGILQLVKIVKNTENTAGVIVGGGEFKRTVKQHIKKQKLCSRIFFLHPAPYLELFKITSSADIGVALIRPVGLSNQYALPNKLFEYALSGIPTLASNLQNMHKVINRHNLGWCVDSKDLKHQIQLIKNYQKSGYSLEQEKLSRFSWEYQHDAFINFVLHGKI
tara:strand:- start:3885 stop:4991 length:1107 start_codon:yes stop_codon:yes gene_type:complete